MATNDEIKEHLDFVLDKVAKIRNIKNCELNSKINMGNANGFIAQFYTGEIRNKDTEETIGVAIKKTQLGGDDFKVLFNNELVFYSTAFPALDHLQKDKKVSQPFKNVPDYFCGSIAEANKEYIAMEYLKPHGYVMCDKTKFFDKEHLICIFQTYAKFHALSYVLQKKYPEIYKKITKDLINVGPTLLEFEDRQVVTAISAAVDALNKEKHDGWDDLQAFKKNIVKNFLNGFEYNGEHRCLIHGDCWSNNMLFKYSNSQKLLNMKLIDFQLCRDGTPILDLAFFFYSGASKRDFDNIEFYLNVYYKSFTEFAKELGANSNEIFSFEVLINEWKENALLGVIFGIWSWQLKLESKEDFNKLINEKDNLSEEDRRKLWKKYMATIYDTATYKENTTSILTHALEYGIIRKDKILKE